MKRIPSIAAIFVGLFLSGCINQEEIAEEGQKKKAGPEFLDTVPKSISDYVPHVEGTSWTYFNGINSDPTSQNPSTQTVGQGNSTNDQFTYVTDVPDQIDKAVESYLVQNDTLYILDSGDTKGARSKIEPMKPLLRFPAKQDSTWTWEGSGRTMVVEDVHHQRVDVVRHRSVFHVDTDVDIQTRAGRFKCIRVEETQTMLDPAYSGYSSMIVSFWASGYGLVKQVSRLQVPGGAINKVSTELAASSLLKGKVKEKKE